MATDLTVVDITLAGAVPGAQVTGAGGGAEPHQFQNNGYVVLEVQNTNAATRTLTVTATKKVAGGMALIPYTVIIPATSRVYLAPWDRSIFNVQAGADEGKVQLDLPAAQEGDLKLRAFRLFN